jgi:hypothetical protein
MDERKDTTSQGKSRGAPHVKEKESGRAPHTSDWTCHLSSPQARHILRSTLIYQAIPSIVTHVTSPSEVLLQNVSKHVHRTSTNGVLP